MQELRRNRSTRAVNETVLMMGLFLESERSSYSSPLTFKKLPLSSSFLDNICVSCLSGSSQGLMSVVSFHWPHSSHSYSSKLSSPTWHCLLLSVDMFMSHDHIVSSWIRMRSICKCLGEDSSSDFFEIREQHESSG